MVLRRHMSGNIGLSEQELGSALLGQAVYVVLCCIYKLLVTASFT